MESMKYDTTGEVSCVELSKRLGNESPLYPVAPGALREG